MFYVYDDIIALLLEERIKFISSKEEFPFDISKQIGPGSIDLRLGGEFLRFKKGININVDTSDDTEVLKIVPGEDIIFEPSEILLANTLEAVFLPANIGGVITGRSSLSRIGLQITISQGFIQPGYANTIPLQLVNLHHDKQIRIPSDIKICQLILIEASSYTTKPYSIDLKSKYGQENVSPEPSKLGIEFGINTQADFPSPKVSGSHFHEKVESWKRKLESEADKAPKRKNNSIEIGEFVTKFLGDPNVVDFGARTSLREDSLYRIIGDFFSNGKKSVKILDVCCGYASWIEHLESSVNDKINHIEYLGVDMNNECVKKVKTNLNKGKFKSFDCIVRHATDLSGLNKGRFDIIVLSNSLHEIEPNLYPSIFSEMNSQLNPDGGRIIVTDMEELPEKEIESISLNWKGDEIERILKIGGFDVSVTKHKKEVQVFQAVIKHNRNIDESKMFIEIKEILRQKLNDNLQFLEYLEADKKDTTIYKMQWLKQTALITRITMSIKNM